MREEIYIWSKKKFKEINYTAKEKDNLDKIK